MKAIIKRAGIAIQALAIGTVCGCRDSYSTDGGAERETMYQVSTLQSLMVGNYDGFVSVSELRGHGNIGLGTFQRADGEMIVLDGTVYQARSDGSVLVADDSLDVPFATVTFFDSDFACTIENARSLDELTGWLTETVQANGQNLIYIARIDVQDCNVLVRSVVPQDKPYRPLAQALLTDQCCFTYNGTGGTIVAVYFPKFFNMQNATGWHCHFISGDRTKGGHLLGFSSAAPMEAHFDRTPYFNMYMPQSDDFARCDLDCDSHEDIVTVEK